MFFIIRKIQSLIFLLIRIIRRAFCCFRLRSNQQQDLIDNTSECLTHVGVVPNRSLETWSNEWEEKPQTIEEHIQSYREKLSSIPAPDPNVQVIESLFQELEPQVIKQKRVVIATEKPKESFSSDNVDLSRLSVVNNFSNELGEWMEEAASGWDEQQLDPNEFLRQQKRSSHTRNKLHTTKLAA